MHSISEAMSGMAHGHRTPRKEPQAAPAGADGAGHTELHDHGDGTFHTVTPDGEKTEHPHLGHALAHIAITICQTERIATYIIKRKAATFRIT